MVAGRVFERWDGVVQQQHRDARRSSEGGSPSPMDEVVVAHGVIDGYSNDPVDRLDIESYQPGGDRLRGGVGNGNYSFNRLPRLTGHGFSLRRCGSSVDEFLLITSHLCFINHRPAGDFTVDGNLYISTGDVEVDRSIPA